MKIRILTDTACDMEIEEANSLGIELVPIQIEVDGNNYRDLYDLPKNKFYELLSKTDSFPKTSQPSVDTFRKYFKQAQKDNETLICILLSSALSGTVQSANLAKDLVGYSEIYIVDSLAAVCAQKLLVMKAYEMANSGKSIQEILDEIKYMQEHLCVFAMIDTLEYLHRGGRLTKTQARLGSLINLKPIITINRDGSLSVIDKCLGRARSYSLIMKKVQEYPIDENYDVYYTYSYGTENCDIFASKIEKVLGVKTNKPYSQIGATVGTHLGAGTYGIIYISKKER